MCVHFRLTILRLATFMTTKKIHAFYAHHACCTQVQYVLFSMMGALVHIRHIAYTRMHSIYKCGGVFGCRCLRHSGRSVLCSMSQPSPAVACGTRGSVYVPSIHWTAKIYGHAQRISACATGVVSRNSQHCRRSRRRRHRCRLACPNAMTVILRGANKGKTLHIVRAANIFHPGG